MRAAAATPGRPVRRVRSRRRRGRSWRGRSAEPGNAGQAATTSAIGGALDEHLVDVGHTAWCSTPRAVEALPCGSRSMTSTRWPCSARAAAMLTAVVVLPTPPFWLATVMTRVCAAGRSAVEAVAERRRPTRGRRHRRSVCRQPGPASRRGSLVRAAGLVGCVVGCAIGGVIGCARRAHRRGHRRGRPSATPVHRRRRSSPDGPAEPGATLGDVTRASVSDSGHASPATIRTTVAGGCTTSAPVRESAIGPHPAGPASTRLPRVLAGQTSLSSRATPGRHSGSRQRASRARRSYRPRGGRHRPR